MGKGAVDIVRHFVQETGVSLSQSSYNNCLNFAVAILQMEKDTKSAEPSVRNCLRYSETKVSDENRISHGTFYNDKSLNAMMNWYLAKSKVGQDVKDNPKRIKELEDSVRKKDRQIKGLLVQQQHLDSINAKAIKAEQNAIRNRILFLRAMSVLKSLGKDHEVDMNVSAEEIGVMLPAASTADGPVVVEIVQVSEDTDH